MPHDPTPSSPSPARPAWLAVLVIAAATSGCVKAVRDRGSIQAARPDAGRVTEATLPLYTLRQQVETDFGDELVSIRDPLGGKSASVKMQARVDVACFDVEDYEPESEAAVANFFAASEESALKGTNPYNKPGSVKLITSDGVELANPKMTGMSNERVEVRVVRRDQAGLPVQDADRFFHLKMRACFEQKDLVRPTTQWLKLRLVNNVGALDQTFNLGAR